MAFDEKTWLITGCSSGFGRELALEALARGHRVVVTARRPESSADILAHYPDRALGLRLDVTSADDIREAVARAEALGGIDVLVNNAGYALMGGVEEVAPDEYRPLFETNFFGSVAMMQAVLPGMRARRRGHIVNISSMGGISGGLGMGFYGATKFAMAAISESLAQEAAPLGIRVTVIEPGSHRTQAISGITQAAVEIADYAETVGRHRQKLVSVAGSERGDARLAAKAIADITEAEDPPLHLPLGSDALERLDRKIDLMSRESALWRDTILSTAVPA